MLTIGCAIPYIVDSAPALEKTRLSGAGIFSTPLPMPSSAEINPAPYISVIPKGIHLPGLLIPFGDTELYPLPRRLKTMNFTIQRVRRLGVVRGETGGRQQDTRKDCSA